MPHTDRHDRRRLLTLDETARELHITTQDEVYIKLKTLWELLEKHYLTTYKQTPDLHLEGHAMPLRLGPKHYQIFSCAASPHRTQEKEDGPVEWNIAPHSLRIASNQLAKIARYVGIKLAPEKPATTEIPDGFVLLKTLGDSLGIAPGRLQTLIHRIHVELTHTIRGKGEGAVTLDLFPETDRCPIECARIRGSRVPYGPYEHYVRFSADPTERTRQEASIKCLSDILYPNVNDFQVVTDSFQPLGNRDVASVARP